MKAKRHILPERLRPGLKLVFCGTAAGRKSALEQAYYAHGQNKFWKTLHRTGLTPRLFAPQDYPLLDELGIGLTDIAKFVFGMDHQLPKDALGTEAAEALRKRIKKFAPRHLAFTSLNAGRTVMGKSAKAGEQSERLGETRVWILPSPSPLADNHWDIQPWQKLAKAVKSDGNVAVTLDGPGGR
ncbi:MAG: mismatch-specific DNA-glycosylase [Alphaproteobacteria bacterium]|nr:mismatch-specific DNA-glycosylase [Alphaproteobacteria bacterium]